MTFLKRVQMVRFEWTLVLHISFSRKRVFKIFLGVLRKKSFLNGQKELEIIYPIDTVKKGLAQESNP